MGVVIRLRRSGLWVDPFPAYVTHKKSDIDCCG